MKEPIRVIASITAKPEKENEAKSVLSSLVHPTRQEPGCLHYELLQNDQDSTQFVLIEEWETQAALDAHTTAEHTQKVQSQMESLMGESLPNFQLYRTIA